MKFAYWIYLFVLVFAPLAFGTTELWSLITVEVLTGFAAIALFSTLLVGGKKIYRIPGSLPLVLLLGFMMLQLLPLPAEIVRVISPSMYEAYRPVLTIGGSEWIPLTINQRATLHEFLRIGSYALMYVLTVHLLSSHVWLKRTVHIVVVLGVTVALIAIIQKVQSPGAIYGFRVPTEGTPFGPWVNPNQYAGFMEMLCPLAIALFLYYRPRAERAETVREKIIAFFSMPGGNLHLIISVAAIIMALSVFVSLCRGGIIAITLSTFVFIALYSYARNQKSRTAFIVIICGVILAVSSFGWGKISAEFNNAVGASGTISDGRFEIWATCWNLFRSYWVTGSGFGTFVDAFPGFRIDSGGLVYDHAHNDYIELLTDGGIIGFGLAAWFVLAVLVHGWQMIRARRDQYAVLIGTGAFTGIIAMLLHGVTDFNMHNGADGLYFFFLCGLLVSAVNTRFSYSASETLLKRQSKQWNLWCLGGCTVLVLSTCVIQYGALRAQWEYAQVRNIYISPVLGKSKIAEVEGAVSKAISHDPWHGGYSFTHGSLSWVKQNREEALRRFLMTVRKQPMNGAALQRVGLLVEDEDLASGLLHEGYRRAFNKDELALTYVEYLLLKGERDAAKTVIIERIELKPTLIQKWALLLDRFNYSTRDMATLLPESVEAWIQYGSYREKQGDVEGAGYYRSNALTFIENEEIVIPNWYQQLIDYYRRTGKVQDALIILRQAVEVLPQVANFHIQLGDYYDQEGITYRAKEEYETALTLEPGNRVAMSRLRKMGLLDAY
jgi:O-antigen ligase/tetratricopeptide (TPR) repeat protein